MFFLYIFTIWHTKDFIYMLSDSSYQNMRAKIFVHFFLPLNLQPLRYSGWCTVGTQCITVEWIDWPQAGETRGILKQNHLRLLSIGIKH